MNKNTRKYKRGLRTGGQTNKTLKNQIYLAKTLGPTIASNALKQAPGFISTVGNVAYNALKDSAEYAVDKGARFFGFKPIDEDDQKLQQQQPPTNSLLTSVTNIASGVAHKAEQVGTIMVDTLNKKLESPEVQETISQAVGNTVKATKNILENANEQLNDPQFVNDIANTARNMSENATRILKAADPSINKFIDQTAKIGTEVGSKVGDSAVSIALNTAEAIPGVGAAIGLVRDVDKAVVAGEAIVEAGLETAGAAAEAISDTEQALNEKQQEVSDITDRTTNNIENFNATDAILNSPITNTNRTNTNTNTNQIKKGGASRKFKRAKRRLSRKLNFRQRG